MGISVSILKQIPSKRKQVFLCPRARGILHSAIESCMINSQPREENDFLPYAQGKKCATQKSDSNCRVANSSSRMLIGKVICHGVACCAKGRTVEWFLLRNMWSRIQESIFHWRGSLSWIKLWKCFFYFFYFLAKWISPSHNNQKRLWCKHSVKRRQLLTLLLTLKLKFSPKSPLANSPQNIIRRCILETGYGREESGGCSQMETEPSWA